MFHLNVLVVLITITMTDVVLSAENIVEPSDQLFQYLSSGEMKILQDDSVALDKVKTFLIDEIKWNKIIESKFILLQLHK